MAAGEDAPASDPVKVPAKPRNGPGGDPQVAIALVGGDLAGGTVARRPPPGGAVADEAQVLLRAKLLGETATAPWQELQRFFAQGMVVWVAPGLDLIEVGLAMSQDRSDLFRTWLENGRAALATDQQARDWLAADADLWTLVIRPWILVQEMAERAAGT